MNKIVPVITFIAGAALGTVVTWQFTKKQYEQRVQEEVESVKKVFSERYDTKPASDEVEEENEEEDPKSSTYLGEKPSVMEYATELLKRRYTPDEEDTTEDKEILPGPVVIPPDEFGEDEAYEKISLTYYADGVLADEMDKIVKDVDTFVGEESLTHFGEWEDDSVFVRNDRFKRYYEILLDQRKYSDVVEQYPYKAEV